MTKARIVVATRLPVAVVERIGRDFDAIIPDHDLDGETALQDVIARQAEGLLVSGKTKLTAEVIGQAPDHLKIVATCSVGFDHIDVAAARRRGLVVTNTPDVLTDCTADMAFLLILAASRRAAEYEQTMRKGWRQAFGMGEFLGLSVSGKTLGILGMGRIGQAVARRARGFGMTILYSNRHRLPADLEQGAEYCADFDAMLPRCDILSVHAPASAETDGIINARTLALLPRGAVFVNTARGKLVDEEALIAALQNGQLFAAGLDVFRDEPQFDLRFATLPNVFLCPHMGSATVETRNAMGFRALDNIAAVCAGKPPIDPLWR
ncbi:D-glycerate dehydrogenase [Telmatospirillum sp.]|uniref:2-hydroxyacid dehydrogenase n=1 Tax=Telmatospirillum sp. TaxID=2079197 RepID=UPI00283C8491|nr:D-glycerate dehydrogenase [Telmatospirillum sp.]MDR3437572.1 D-glycerate dehydrogenase [Telmatospirillum sp.]